MGVKGHTCHDVCGRSCLQVVTVLVVVSSGICVETGTKGGPISTPPPLPVLFFPLLSLSLPPPLSTHPPTTAILDSTTVEVHRYEHVLVVLPNDGRVQMIGRRSG